MIQKCAVKGTGTRDYNWLKVVWHVAGFKKLFANSKGFCAKRQRIYLLIQYKIKETVKKIMNIYRTFS
jgi:hypothetical protein